MRTGAKEILVTTCLKCRPFYRSGMRCSAFEDWRRINTEHCCIYSTTKPDWCKVCTFNSISDYLPEECINCVRHSEFELPSNFNHFILEEEN